VFVALEISYERGPSRRRRCVRTSARRSGDYQIECRWASAPISVQSVVNADMRRSLLELLTSDRIGELNHCFASTMGVHSGMSSFVRPTHRDWASMDTALASHGCHIPLAIRDRRNLRPMLHFILRGTLKNLSGVMLCQHSTLNSST
jgi:hypothetical protein